MIKKIIPAVVGLFLFVSGHFILSLAASIVYPVIADAIARAGDYRSKTGILASYVVFCYGLTGPILPDVYKDVRPLNVISFSPVQSDHAGTVQDDDTLPLPRMPHRVHVLQSHYAAGQTPFLPPAYA